MNPTVQQSAFLDALVSSTSNLALIARAGCGKTTTIELGIDAYHAAFPDHDIWACAYNKPIASELEKRLKAKGYDWKRVQATTVHSAGWGLVRFAFRLDQRAINEYKVRDLIRARIDARGSNWLVLEIYQSQINALVSYAKQSGVGFFDDAPIGDPGVWYALADHYDVNGLEDTSEMDAVVGLSQQIYRTSLAQTDVIDFNDMILFPLIKSLRVKFTKDLILVDEYQDISRARRALIRKFLKPGGRIGIIGDPAQAIYGFSGADTEAMDNGIAEFNAEILPLSVTWRCPKSVVKLAQSIVPDLEAAESAPEGEVLHKSRFASTSEITDTNPEDPRTVYMESLIPGKHSDVILCRNTKPLVEIAYDLIRAKVPCKVEGRAIGEGLIRLAQRWKVKSTDALLRKLEEYKDKEIQKALAKGSESKAQEVEDKVSTLECIIQAVNAQGKNTVQDVVEFIESLFADGEDNVVTLATYHRSKGREWDRVFLFEHASRCPSRAARQEWQRRQERNLAYVAYTRAKKSLIFVG